MNLKNVIVDLTVLSTMSGVISIISVIVTTLIIYHSFTLSLQAPT